MNEPATGNSNTVSSSPVVTMKPLAKLHTQSRWTIEALMELFTLPLLDLVHRAQQIHREHFDPNEMRLASLLSIKTGGCAENCGYCPQSAHFETGVAASRLMDVQAVVEAAHAAKSQGATRFCMGAAWRSPKERDMQALEAMINGVKALGMQTCMTLGMLDETQADRLARAGLDYYNHNLDSAPDYYEQVVTTRRYDDRLQTLQRVRNAGIHVCAGGIVGMGESREQRAGLIAELANLDPYPESVPINHLVPVDGTPMASVEPLDPFEFVRTIAVTRIAMPAAVVRLSAGREQMHEAVQALCFMAGANSIFYGDHLLTTSNPQAAQDRALLERLGMRVTR